MTSQLPHSADELELANSELLRLNRALRGVAACNEALVCAGDEEELFNEVCRALVEHGGYFTAWVGYAERDAKKSVRPIAHFGLARGTLDFASISWAEGSSDSGPTGTAIRTGAGTVAHYAATDCDIQESHAGADRHAPRASLALPLRDNDTVVGALTIDAEDVEAFQGPEVKVLAEAANALSLRLTRLRTPNDHGTRRSLVQYPDDWLQVAVKKSPLALFLLQPILDAADTVTDFTILDVNSRTMDLLRLPRDRIVGHTVTEAFSTYQTALIPRYVAVLKSGTAAEEVFDLSTAKGRTIWVRHHVMPIAQGLAVTWRDVTRLVEASRKLAATQKDYRELVESLQEGIWAIDGEGRTTFANPAMAQILGCTVDEMLGKSPLEFVDERLHESLKRHLTSPTRKERERYDFEFRRKDENAIFVQIAAAPRYDAARNIVGRIAGVMDITARKQAEEKLRESLLTLAKAEELAHVGTWSYLRTDKVYNVSDEMRRILGLPPGASQLSNETVIGLFHPDDRDGAMKDLAAMLRGQRLRNERRIVRPDGEERVLLFQSDPVLDDAGRVTRVDGFARDVTERKHNEAKLAYLATHDALTALPNRRVLEDRLGNALTHLTRHPGKSLAVLYLDLDRFKFVNDSLGHATGDELLKHVAEALRSTVRTDDTVARQGGDEFIILLQDIRQPSDVIFVAEKIQKALARPFLIQGQQLYAAVSIGVSLYPTDGRTIQTLLKNADAAMYRAKQSGGGVRFHTRDMSRQAAERLGLENSLRRALEHEEFELYYQPQVALPSGHIVSAEALIRWNHPTEGLILPGRFIKVAEDTGLIDPIGEWALRTSSEDSRRWRKEGLPAITVAVNVAAPQFRTGRLEALVSTMTHSNDLNVDCLELEITERMVMENVEGAIDRLRKLRDLGVKVAIDDFGTGYSSLAYFRRLPIDKIKIAQSFVRDVESSEDARKLVRAIIDLSRAFDLTVLAEGVETAAQAQFVAQHRCHNAQGFYYARPMPVDQFAALLRRGDASLPA